MAGPIFAPRALAVSVWGAALIGLVALVAACGDGAEKTNYLAGAEGDVERGQQLIRGYGCQSCHAIPGIGGTSGVVGPSLEGIASEEQIAGMLPTSPLNLARWIRDPKSVNEATLMPDVGVSDEDAQDIVGYLATLD